ncbi:MAG: hypothetical protein M3Q23_15540 [Actinomycetota bacterium]|nr:hypothetical protein [Actinomycetota bacterium]
MVRGAYLITGDREEAADVAQEAFARAYERWGLVSRLDRPGAWVERVATNLAPPPPRGRSSARATTPTPLPPHVHTHRPDAAPGRPPAFPSTSRTGSLTKRAPQWLA